MKILIVANHNTNSFSPFVLEQVESLKKLGVEFDFYGVHGKAIRGYLSNRGALIRKIRQFQPDLIHAHYGLSGLLANLQRKVPVVTTYHGSDIHSGGQALFFSRMSLLLSRYNIFVADYMIKLSGYRGRNVVVIPCGIDDNTFQPMDKIAARKQLGWSLEDKYILFAGSFTNDVKDPELAKAAVNCLKQQNRCVSGHVELIELKGYTRSEVAMLLNASDCMLLTSHQEGSPQVVKEAMACCCPVVSVDVGDVATTIGGLDGCVITTREPADIAASLSQVLNRSSRTNGRERIMELSLTDDMVAARILEIYHIAIKH